MTKQFTDLVLLVDTNPLPNYVVAKHFIQRNEDLNCIWLLCSEEQESIDQNSTQEIGERIRRVLRHEFRNKDLKFQFISISDADSARHIRHTIRNNMKDLTVRDRTFHLNYTGSTKTIAVHTYRTLEKLFKNNCTFSYLDGREHRIKFDDDSPRSDDLRLEISISLENLLDLHGYKADFQVKCSKTEEGFLSVENLSAYTLIKDNYGHKTIGRELKLDSFLMFGYQICTIVKIDTQDISKVLGKALEIKQNSKKIGGEKTVIVSDLSIGDIKTLEGLEINNCLFLNKNQSHLNQRITKFLRG